MFHKPESVTKLLGFLLMAALVVGLGVQSLSAQVTIPQGSTINSAVFSVYATYSPTSQNVNLHRILNYWGETSVTWNNFGGYDPILFGSFLTGGSGWKTADLTGLMQAWVNGTYPNFGFVMIQGPTPYTVYHSSESTVELLRPKLDITYTTPAGMVNSVTIQSTLLSPDNVIDAYIWQINPNYTGNSAVLYTGNVNGYEKYSLLQFSFTVIPPPPGTGTPGYWMNHPEAWPEPGITIGGDYYPIELAIELMKMSGAGDKTYTMFAALVAAKLNVMIGNDASCVSSTIAAADAWMTTYPVGSGVFAGGPTSPWRGGEPLYLLLDNYNNGLLCAPSRDLY